MSERTIIESAEQVVIVPWAPVRNLVGFLRRLNLWLRDFPWLTSQRLIFYSGILLLVYLVAAFGQLRRAQHLVFETGRSVGGDFVDPYAASVAALAGAPASVYDLHRQHLREAAITEE